MSKLFNTVTFSLFSTEKDIVTLRDFADNKKSVTYKRSAPKRVKDFPGMEKSEVKMTLTDPTLGVIGIVTVSSSIRADSLDPIRTDLILSVKDMVNEAAYSDLVTDQRLPLNA